MKLKYAIELYFDKDTEQKLYNLSLRVAEEKLSTKFLEWKTRPHLTLACFNDIDEIKCTELLRNFADSHRVMPAYIGSVGMFNDTKTIFVSPLMNSGMYQLHRELHQCLKEFDTNGWEYYCPERWAPHCTIALTKEDKEDVFYKASDLVLHEFEKIQGEFTAIGLAKVTLPVEEIFIAQLSR